jgi:TniQ/Tn7-like transposition protein D
MYLPRPYPDEIVGSALNRAVRLLGLGHVQLLQRLVGHKLIAHSFLVTKFAGVAQAYGMPLDEFLDAHTVLPYVMAFMTRRDRQRVITTLITGHHPRGETAALTLRTSLERQPLRLCPICVGEERSTYGESYWHRTHQLSGVEVCEKHNADLLVTEFIAGRAPNVPPPHEVRRVTTMGSDTSDEARWAIACVSALLLRSSCDQAQLTRDYRRHALLMGYLNQVGAVHQAQLLHDLRLYFGAPFLARYQCSFDDSKKGQWPIKLLLESAHVATSLRHVLLMAFMESHVLSLPKMPSRPPRH